MGALGWSTRTRFRQQLAAADRLLPAEAWRARTAILLSCGDPALEMRARQELRFAWGVDHVIGVATPVRAIAAADAQTSPWLRAWLAREIRDLSPALIAVAAHPACAHVHGPCGSLTSPPTLSDLEAAAAQLRGWGVNQNVEPLWLGV